jgi:hypothetical protein
MTSDLSNEAAANRYAYKASLIGAAHQFELTEEGLSWQLRGKSGVWPYADIAVVRLSYRPISMQSRRFRADIERKDGQSIAIFSTSWQTVALMAPQDREYRAFIIQLHERMKRAGSRATLIGGIKSGIYAAGVAVMALLAIALAGLLARAIGTGEFGGALFLVGFAALFAWQVGGFIRRNRPQTYTFDQLPQALLPQGK